MLASLSGNDALLSARRISHGSLVRRRRRHSRAFSSCACAGVWTPCSSGAVLLSAVVDSKDIEQQFFYNIMFMRTPRQYYARHIMLVWSARSACGERSLGAVPPCCVFCVNARQRPLSLLNVSCKETKIVLAAFLRLGGEEKWIEGIRCSTRLGARF